MWATFRFVMDVRWTDLFKWLILSGESPIDPPCFAPPATSVFFKEFLWYSAHTFVDNSIKIKQRSLKNDNYISECTIMSIYLHITQRRRRKILYFQWFIRDVLVILCMFFRKIFTLRRVYHQIKLVYQKGYTKKWYTNNGYTKKWYTNNGYTKKWYTTSVYQNNYWYTKLLVYQKKSPKLLVYGIPGIPILLVYQNTLAISPKGS